MGTESRRMERAYFGGNFTGSPDALEVLAFAGLRVALFLEPPTHAAIARTGELEAIGVNGNSRAMSTRQMDVRLPPGFDALARCGTAVVHYMVCSTVDSTKTIGSIGHAKRLARPYCGKGCIPVVVGTSALKRYCIFANRFVRSATDDRTYRIDRDPITHVRQTDVDERERPAHRDR